MILSQIITETLLGAVTGYVTNDVAIRSLFKKGGVIEKTRDAFIREASALLEEQVLTGAVLQQQLELPEVEAAMQQLLYSFFQENLPQCLEQYHLKDIADKEVLFARIHKDLYDLWQQQEEQIAALLTASFDLDKVLTENQRASLENKLLYVFTEQLQEGRYIERFLQQLQVNYGEKTWREIGLEEWINGLTEQLGRLCAHWGTSLVDQYEQQLIEQLQKLLQQFDLEGLLQQLQKEWGQIPVGQFLNCDATQLSALFRELLGSERGQQLLERAAAYLLEALSSVNLSLKELLPDETVVALKPFLEEELPVLLQRLLAWLEENQIILTQLVDEAVDEVFDSHDGIKGFTLQLVKESMLHNIVQEYGFLIKLEQLLQDKTKIAQVADLAIAQINVFFAEQKIGDLISGFKLKRQKLQKVVQALLEENLLFYLEKRGAEHLYQFLQRPLYSCLPENWMNVILEKIDTLLPVYLLEQLAQIDSIKLSSQIQQQILSQKIGENVSERFAQWGQEKAEQFLRTETHFIESWWHNLDMKALTKLLLERIDAWLQNQFPDWLKKQEQLSLKLIFHSLVSERWMKEVVPGAISFLQQKMISVTNGQLSALAEQQLNRLSNDEIRILVQDFMGKELKPLNYLGALLGSAVGFTTGAVLSAGMLPVGLTGAQAAAALIGGKSFLFGAVGYGTNCAAIKGLFRPYKPVFGIEMLQGVIPKQQRSFAHGMGEMVERYVLNEGILQDLLIGNQENWVAKSVILSQKPVVLQEVLHQVIGHKEKLVHGSHNSLVHFIQEDFLPCLMPLGKKPLADFYPAAIWTGDRILLEQGIDLVKCKLTSLKEISQPLSDYVTAEMVSQLAAQSISKMDMPKIKSYWQRFQNHAGALSVIVSEQQQNDLVIILKRQLFHKVTGASAAKTICDAIERFFAEENLGTALGGQLGSWLERNIARLLQSLFEMLFDTLESKEAALVKKVQGSIVDRLSIMQKMGYSMMNGDRLVAQVIQRIIQVKLPLFLGLKQQEIADVVMQYWYERLSVVSLGQLQLILSPQAVQELTGKIFALPAVQEGTSELLQQAIEQLVQQPIHLYARYLELDGLLDYGQQWLQKRWELCRKDMVEDSMLCFMPFLNQELQTMSTAQLLSSVSLDMIQKMPLAELLHAGGGDKLWCNWYQSCIQSGGNLAIEQWLDWPLVVGQIQLQCKALMKSEGFLQWWYPLLEQELERLAADLETILPEATRDQLVRIVVQSFLNSIYDFGAPLLQTMDLGSLTEKQIMEMEPQRLEAMVWGFGRSYLLHIQNMGWLGAAFAIPGIFLTLFS